MKTKFFDCATVVKENDEHPMEDWMIDRLDEMLDEFGVRHAFSLPFYGKDGEVEDEHYCNVFYDERQHVTFNLVYGLWLNTVRGFNSADDDDKICRAFAKIIEKREVK